MKPFQIIPAIDLKSGVVVHGLGGKRRQYRPVRSAIAGSPTLEAVVDACQRLGLSRFYVADLDALGPIQPGSRSSPTRPLRPTSNLKLLQKLLTDRPITCLVDAGVTSHRELPCLFSLGIHQAVMGTETLADLGELEKAVRVWGPEKIVVSLDLLQGRVLSRSPELQLLTPTEALRLLARLGVASVILLEIDRVGTGRGINRDLVSLCLRTLEAEALPGGGLLAGGGVRCLEDLRWLQEAGAAGALVATLLHQGKLTVEDLAAFNSAAGGA
ncbi:MAG: HisA/HisF-related TIM barrel protein [Clostridia bacterium]|jgi:phosphoribosylformimino-5-aminoimidazole carboxamide ribotide isomerase|nr:HisA/HisF-related TIM barrel protein [Clostridia bacterium]MDH7572300.1 HisA/HisF-related TIM barrel protein [Clostridia bacterium]